MSKRILVINPNTTASMTRKIGAAAAAAASAGTTVSAVNPDGSMTWETAMNWVNDLNQYVYKVDTHGYPIGTKGYLDHTDWTLPPIPKGDQGAATLVAAFAFASWSARLLGHIDVARERMTRMMAIVNGSNPYEVAFSWMFDALHRFGLREYEQAEASAARAL